MLSINCLMDDSLALLISPVTMDVPPVRRQWTVHLHSLHSLLGLYSIHTQHATFRLWQLSFLKKLRRFQWTSRQGRYKLVWLVLVGNSEAVTMKIKEIDRTANVAWSPASQHPIYLAAGTAAQQLDATFRWFLILLWFWFLKVDDSNCGYENVDN